MATKPTPTPAPAQPDPDPAPQEQPSQPAEEAPQRRSALDDPEHPLHHLRNA